MPNSQTIEQLLAANPRLRKRVEALDEALMTSTALLNGYSERVAQARDKLNGAQADLNYLQTNYSHLPRVDDRDDPGSDKRGGILLLSVIDKHEQTVSDARDELNRATVNKNRAAASKGTAAHFAAAKDDFLALAAANGGLSEVSVKIPRNATTEGSRSEWTELLKGRKAVENSVVPITPDDIRALVAAKAEPARLVVTSRGKVLIEPPVVRVAAEPTMAGAVPNAPDALALLCRHMPEAVIADLVEQAKNIAASRMFLTRESKARKLADIDGEVLRLQRVEAELVWNAREAGQDVWFAKGLDIRAVLGVDGPTPEKRR